jgi:hypothetical protein
MERQAWMDRIQIDPTVHPASWTQIFIYGESRRIMPYIVVRSPRC